MAVERVLSRRELNRAVLARQLLLERGRPDVPAALAAVGGIQAQYAPSMYVGLFARLDGVRRDAVTRALESRTAIQATLMRLTIHLVARDDFWPLALATRDARRRLWLRGYPQASEEEMAAAARTVRARLAGTTLRRTEIEALVGKVAAKGVGQWLDMVRVPPSGTWERRRADLYGLAEDWLGPPPQGAAEAGVELLVRRYLTAFGPARRAEIADWAGVGVRALAPALDRLELVRYADAGGRELLDLPGLPLPDPDTPAPVRFLPTWDAVLLVHARRSQVLPEEHRPRIFNTRMPQSVPTFLVDGAVAGTWRVDGERIAVEPFGRLDRATRRAVAAEAERVQTFHVG